MIFRRVNFLISIVMFLSSMHTMVHADSTAKFIEKNKGNMQGDGGNAQIKILISNEKKIDFSLDKQSIDVFDNSDEFNCPCFGPKPSSLDEKRLQPFFLS
jgi:hypothetical protein